MQQRALSGSGKNPDLRSRVCTLHVVPAQKQSQMRHCPALCPGKLPMHGVWSFLWIQQNSVLSSPSQGTMEPCSVSYNGEHGGKPRHPTGVSL